MVPFQDVDAAAVKATRHERHKDIWRADAAFAVSRRTGSGMLRFRRSCTLVLVQSRLVVAPPLNFAEREAVPAGNPRASRGWAPPRRAVDEQYPRSDAAPRRYREPSGAETDGKAHALSLSLTNSLPCASVTATPWTALYRLKTIPVDPAHVVMVSAPG